MAGRGSCPFSGRRENSYYNVSGTWFRNIRPNIINEFRANWDRRTFINRTAPRTPA